jgi:hypothetical protein
MTQRSFVRARADTSASAEIKPEAKDDGTQSNNAFWSCVPNFVKKAVFHGLRTGIDVTAAKDRSVWTPRPPVG